MWHTYVNPNMYQVVSGSRSGFYFHYMRMCSDVRDEHESTLMIRVRGIHVCRILGQLPFCSALIDASSTVT